MRRSAMIGQSGIDDGIDRAGHGLAEYGDSRRLALQFRRCSDQAGRPAAGRLGAGLRLLGLPAMETQVVVLLSSMAVGANVYLMSRQFKALEGPVPVRWCCRRCSRR
jgi:malonate transporter